MADPIKKDPFADLGGTQEEDPFAELGGEPIEAAEPSFVGFKPPPVPATDPSGALDALKDAGTSAVNRLTYGQFLRDEAAKARSRSPAATSVADDALAWLPGARVLGDFAEGRGQQALGAGISRGASFGMADDALRLAPMGSGDKAADELQHQWDDADRKSPLLTMGGDLIGTAGASLLGGTAARAVAPAAMSSGGVAAEIARSALGGAATSGARAFGEQDPSTPMGARIRRAVPAAAAGAIVTGGVAGLNRAYQGIAPALKGAQQNARLQSFGVSPTDLDVMVPAEREALANTAEGVAGRSHSTLSLPPRARALHKATAKAIDDTIPLPMTPTTPDEIARLEQLRVASKGAANQGSTGGLGWDLAGLGAIGTGFSDVLKNGPAVAAGGAAVLAGRRIMAGRGASTAAGALGGATDLADLATQKVSTAIPKAGPTLAAGIPFRTDHRSVGAILPMPFNEQTSVQGTRGLGGSPAEPRSDADLPPTVRYAQAIAQPTRENNFGAVEPGNIDLRNRPIVNNPDGSQSTVRSIGVNLDGKEYLIPTVSDDGRVMGDDEAVEYFKKSGKHLGVYSSQDASSRAAEAIHQDQVKNPPRDTLGGNVPPTVQAAGAYRSAKDAAEQLKKAQQ